MVSSSGYLLDVNVLLALAWPTHEHHSAALSWFIAHRELGWATCALTELGFIRISSNRRFAPVPASTRTAAAALQQLKLSGRHRYFAELPGEVLAKLFSESELGHADVTDWYLLALARHHRAQLATFDRGMESALRRNAADASPLALLP